jgi:hypothetical protein
MFAGPITGCALGAVRRILDKNVLGRFNTQMIGILVSIMPDVSVNTRSQT